MPSSCVVGMDIGAGSTKAVLADLEGRILATFWARTLPNLEKSAEEVLEALLAQGGVERTDVSYLVTTGLGRYNVPFRDVQVTDITSGARGAYALFGATRSVLDIGAQCTRAMRLTEQGRVAQFHTNDKCAAGSGGFIEKAAQYLEVSLEDVGDLSMEATEPQMISSVCAVLAESEIINHISEGRRVEDILRGIHNSLANRSRTLLKRVGVQPELTLIGGVGRQQGMVTALEETLQMKVNVPETPDLVCALGACLLGVRRLKKQRQLEVVPPAESARNPA